MSSIAVARFGITVMEFYDMTPLEFTYAMQDWNKVKQLEVEEMNKTVFESMRFQTMLIYNMNPYRKKSLRKPSQLFKLPWEKAKAQTVGQMKTMLHALAAAFGTKDKKK